MARIISISNQKGGSGKTTTALALGAGLRQRGFTVLFIDLDAQCNLSYVLSAQSRPLSSLEVLTGTADAADAIVKTPLGDIIPASPSLAGADKIITELGKEYRLKEALQTVESTYDFIIIDTAPALSILSVNAFTASTSVVIPSQADTFSLQGIASICSTLAGIKKYTNTSLKIDGILLTRYSSRSVLSKDLTRMIEQAAKDLGSKVFSARIRECIAVKEAQAMQQDIFAYAPKSNAATDYTAFIDELLAQ